MPVGFGAGAASLDNHYELLGPDLDLIMAWDDGVGTSGDWKRLPRKLNSNTVKKVNDWMRTSR